MIKYKIYLYKKSSTGIISRDESFISDGTMVTRHNNPADTFRIWKEKAQKGEAVVYKRGILKENFVDQTAKDIKEHVETELNLLKDSAGKDMEITWRIEEC